MHRRSDELDLLGKKKAPKWNPAVEQANKIMASEGGSEWLHCHWTGSRMFLVTLSPSLYPADGRTIIPSANNAGKKEEGGKTYKQVGAPPSPGQP